MKFSPELIDKAKQAASAVELMDVAKESGMELTKDEAAAYYAQLNPTEGELSDDELDNVSGGSCGSIEINGQNYRQIDQSELHQCCDRYICGSCGCPGGSHADSCSSGWICGHKCSTCGNLKRIADGVYACLAQPL